MVYFHPHLEECSLIVSLYFSHWPPPESWHGNSISHLLLVLQGFSLILSSFCFSVNFYSSSSSATCNFAITAFSLRLLLQIELSFDDDFDDLDDLLDFFLELELLDSGSSTFLSASFSQLQAICLIANVFSSNFSNHWSSLYIASSKFIISFLVSSVILNKLSSWLSSSLTGTKLPLLIMVDFLCNLAASFFLLPSNVDSWYFSPSFWAFYPSFFLVTSAALGSSMLPFKPSDQLLLW